MMKVPSTGMKTRDDFKPETTTIYEIPELEALMKVHRAERLLQMALHDDTLLFDLPSSEFKDPKEAYEIMIRQIGALRGARIIQGKDHRKTDRFMIEGRFEEETATEKAIIQGLIGGDMQCRAIMTRLNRGDLPKMTRVHVAGIPFDDIETLKTKLITSLGYYGKVCQIQILKNMGVFEGAISVLLDTDANQGEFEQLQRMIYLEAWQKHVPANFKGQPPVCYHCRQSGHLKRDCPILAAIVCYRCSGKGHISRHCKEDELAPRKSLVVENEQAALKKQKISNENENEKDEKRAKEKVIETKKVQDELASQYAPGNTKMMVDNKQDMLKFSSFKSNTKRRASQSTIPISVLTSKFALGASRLHASPSVLAQSLKESTSTDKTPPSKTL